MIKNEDISTYRENFPEFPRLRNSGPKNRKTRKMKYMGNATKEPYIYAKHYKTKEILYINTNYHQDSARIYSLIWYHF